MLRGRGALISALTTVGSDVGTVPGESPSIKLVAFPFMAHINTATTVGPKNCKVQLRTCDILSEIQSSIDIINPVTLDNHYVNSAITKISMTGLRGNATHISILGMEFTSQLSYDFCQMLTQAESLKISMQNPKESKLQFIGEIDCRWILTDRKLSVVVKDFFSHVKIFYWKWPFIELHFELCEPREILQSTPSDVPHPAFCITTSHPLIKAAVSDDNRVVYNLPNIAPLEDELQHMHATPDDGVTSTAETIKVACEDNSFGILLDSALLYSIIKDGLVGKAYPQTFETRVPIENSEITVLLKVLPFKSRSSHISIWAEVTAPSQTDGQVTLEVTAFDPQRDERLGHTVKRTEKLKCSDLGECERARIILDDVMSHTFAFYRSPDIELYIKIIAS